MTKAPALIDVLVDQLRRLPGVGPKTAQRYAYHLLQHDRDAAMGLGKALQDAAQGIKHCQLCNTFTTEAICDTCLAPERDPSLLCVVETPADQAVMEQTLAFSGRYFVLMGRLSPLDGIGPSDLAFERLVARVNDGDIGGSPVSNADASTVEEAVKEVVLKEVVLATSFTQEGEATAHYLGEILKARGVKVSRLARGVPIGSELEYVDPSTVAHAMRDRRSLN